MILRRVVFSLPEAGLSLMFAAINSWYLWFLTSVGGMTPVLAGLAFFLGRLIDACVDPFVGVWADGQARRRPRTRLVGAALVPTAVLFACLWMAPLAAEGQAVKALLVTAVFAAFGIGYTCTSVPRLAMLPGYAAGRPARAAQVMTDMILSLLAVAAGVVLLPALASALGGGAAGWGRAGASAGLAVILVCLPFLLVVRDRSPGIAAAPPAIRAAPRGAVAALRLPGVCPALLLFWVTVLCLFQLQSILPFFLERRIGVPPDGQIPRWPASSAPRSSAFRHGPGLRGDPARDG